MMYESETWAASSTVMAKIDCSERKLLSERREETSVWLLLAWGETYCFAGDNGIATNWIDSVQALAEERVGSAELWSRTTHLGEDAGNRVRRP
ncbi:hypothetical protein RB195_007110 [Necator americanus]|uniref:PH domain-containing protein n=1 Tax=Necator americanus TaxID=51031 RepID=A0ABR1BYY5_NECAM